MLGNDHDEQFVCSNVVEGVSDKAMTGFAMNVPLKYHKKQVDYGHLANPELEI